MDPRRKYCSKECSLSTRKSERVCHVCDNTFQGFSAQKYCSDFCYTEGSRINQSIRTRKQRRRKNKSESSTSVQQLILDKDFEIAFKEAKKLKLSSSEVSTNDITPDKKFLVRGRLSTSNHETTCDGAFLG